MKRTREVAVLVHRQREVLVLRRTLGEPYWHVVAGGVEGEESDVQAAERELLEETGLSAPGRVYALRHSHAYGDVTLEAFAVEAPSQWQPVLNHEHSEYRWCSFDEAVDTVRWPDTKQALRLLESRLPRPRSQLTLERSRSPAVFFLHFEEEAGANEVAEVLRSDGFQVTVAPEPAYWLVQADAEIREDSLDVAERALVDLAAAKGGRYAGHRAE